MVAQMVKNPPEIQETEVQSLGWEDPLEVGMATHSSILDWRIPWIAWVGEMDYGLQSIWLQRIGQDWSNLALKDVERVQDTQKEKHICFSMDNL